MNPWGLQRGSFQQKCFHSLFNRLLEMKDRGELLTACVENLGGSHISLGEVQPSYDVLI